MNAHWLYYLLVVYLEKSIDDHTDPLWEELIDQDYLYVDDGLHLTLKGKKAVHFAIKKAGEV